MRKTSAVLAAILGVLIVLALTSCSTVPVAQRPQTALRVVSLFNAGDIQSLDNISQLPFLFNGEIVELHGDVNTLWTNLVKSGVKLGNAQVMSASAIGPDSYKQFAATMEVKVFFEKYLPKGSAVVELASSAGRFDLLLAGAHSRFPVIVGLKAGAE